MEATFTHKGRYSHVPGYAEIMFQQGLDGDGWDLVAQPWGRLVYHRAGEFATVPNIHYNQPAAWRIDALRWQADSNDERARSHDEAAGREPWRAHEAKMAREQAARLRAMADAMERDGNGRTIAADPVLPPWPIGRAQV